jgi:hypothetical protein
MGEDRMKTPAKIHVVPSSDVGDPSALPQDAIKVAVVQPLTEESMDAFLVDLALSLWLLRQEPKALGKCA